jgi:hypothetical protein
MTIFPTEKYIDLENNPYLLGRITVNQVRDDFNAEVDIIHRESHKIFKHVDIIYRQPSAEEALIVGVQRLRTFLENLEKMSESSKDDVKEIKPNHH